MRRFTIGAGLVATMAALAAGCSSDELGPVPDAAGSTVDAFVFVTPDAAPVIDAAPAIDAAPPIDARPPADAALPSDAPPGADAAPTPDAASADATPSPDAGPLSCLETGEKVTTSTVLFGETFAGATNSYVFNSNQCGSDPPDSAERIFNFELTSPIEWYAETRCGSSSSWDCELVLTKDGCADANVVSCETSPGDETMSGLLQPGKYAVFLEGDNPEDPAVFDFMVNFNHTGGLAQCAATTVNVIDPANCEDPTFDSPNYHLVLEDVTSPEDIDDFFVEGVDGCDNDQDHVGGAPDKVYRLVLPDTRDVTVELESPDWDALLYVTGSPCGAREAVQACSDDLTGDTESVDVTLGAGTWYIVVDGFGEETFNSGSWGAFTLDVKVYDDACNE